ncbi:hypothetical protein HMN09_01114600 [Mycena chlorophos]|uniref:Uncharacterized protein n=1 Tax=Mycena chlorophos TaxID=658473 RepID=A0A8H6SDT0_MYCCL|nr:hypothetical protein HMN09_01114600 [Mycena chlorophos]
MAGLEPVAFPTTDKNYQPAPRPRPPHLPFRRISLPSNPNPRHRESVVSVASFDSLPEEEASPASPSMPAVMRNVNGRKPKVRPTSTAATRKPPRHTDPRETKRRKVIQEFFETEKAYVDGLDLIYSHFLTPIIASLETSQPLLQRSDLASVFSNFVDIWNLHRAFYAALSDRLLGNPDADPPALSPLLLSHFPYLSLYNPFITSFPSTISSMTNLISPPTATHPNPQYSPTFAAYLLAQEADPRCMKLRLRDWLLTIVQRCPRYLLLLKDLISCTDPEDPEHGQLTAVHALVSKITLTLNTSIHTHAQTLSLLALQRNTPNLPFQLIVPGRSLVKRGPLSHVELSCAPRDREFLLFSDCIIWLEADDGWVGGSSPAANNSHLSPVRPSMVRTRSKSDAELPLRGPDGEIVGSKSMLPLPPARKSAYHHPVSRMKRRQNASTGPSDEGKWTYKGRAELVDLEVVVTPPRELGEERRFEVLSPEGSFVLYADSEEDRDEWTTAIRQTKAQLFISLNATHPDSTLTSSSSTAHLRRSLQALPFPPSDERLTSPKLGGKKGKKIERRGRVEHWVPAIWIPDEKTEGCMRCGRTFGWRRRRHHCRLCGRCVCSSCSDRTFFIADPNSKDDSSKPARACNACYETVFPLLDNPSEEDELEEPSNMLEAHSNTLTSLSNFPSWLSMPSLPLTSTPEALMAIDRGQHKQQQVKYERLRRGDVSAASQYASYSHVDDGGEPSPSSPHGVGVVRVRSPAARPKSYHQILEDFEESSRMMMTSPLDEEDEDSNTITTTSTRSHSRPETIVDLGDDDDFPREDTARRNKRFSMPAVSLLQTTSVTARTQVVPDKRAGGVGSAIAGQQPLRGARAKRFSLVLGTKPHGGGRSHSELVLGKSPQDHDMGPDLGKGIAAGKLSELLGKHKAQTAPAA